MTNMLPQKSHTTPQGLMAVLQKASAYLTKYRCPSPRLEAEYLLAHVLKCKRLQLYLDHDRPLHPGELNRYRELIQKRAKRIPLAYLVEECEFWGLALHINPHVLIPSPDSETLVESSLKAIAALRKQQSDRRLLIVELGVGSGALPLAVCHEQRNVCWLGLEKSALALTVAQQNLCRHASLLAPKQNAILLTQGDCFHALNPKIRPHLLVSNPPYIPSQSLALLQPEVSEATPHMALDGGPEGVVFQRYLLDWGLVHLQSAGTLLMEMGAEQSSILHNHANSQQGWGSLDICCDLGKRPRVFRATKAA